jgi:hypothetical protein
LSTIAVLAPPSEAPPPDVEAGAEDLHVGEALMPTGTLAIAPPSPPRVSVDLEPDPADDPRDFELPAR